MCGCFALKNPRALYTVLNRLEIPEIKPRSHIRPGEPEGALIARKSKSGTAIHLDRLKWGFRVAKDKPFAPINARAETLFQKWPWRNAALHHRCLIPMDGFYEPKGPKKQKNRPQYYFQLPEEKIFFVAGIWAPPITADALDTFSLITTAPNHQVSPIHDRMPAILDAQAQQLWLSDSNDITALQKLLQPWAGEPLACYPV